MEYALIFGSVFLRECVSGYEHQGAVWRKKQMKTNMIYLLVNTS
jgi:hypothetical protein